MPLITQNFRLQELARAVRENAVFADVGCDHGYLSLYLMMHRKARRGYACDISRPPLEKARRAIREAGLEQQIETRQTDGLHGLAGCGITDIAIAGMGGEMIATILREAPFTKDPSICLALQPMSREAVLRRFLAENGYALLEETAVQSGGRAYSVMTACYTGICRTLSGFEAYAGLLPKWCGGTSQYAEAAADRLARTCLYLEDQAKGAKARGDKAEAHALNEIASLLRAVPAAIFTQAGMH